MKKIAIVLTAMILLSTAAFKAPFKTRVGTTSAMNSEPQFLSTRSDILYENFESYPLGKFQTTKDWDLYLVSPEYSEKQCIVDSFSVSPSKSLQLWSHGGGSGVMLTREIEISGDYIGYQVYVMMASLWEARVTIAFANTQYHVGFSEIWLWADKIEAAAYDDFFERRIGVWLQESEAMRWYNITVITNKNTYEFSVWIDNVLKKSGLKEEPGRSEYGPINCFDVRVEGGYEDQEVYFDDISVFQETEQPQTNMELTIFDKEKWYTNLNVPFDIPGAKQYVIDAKNNGKPGEEDFGNALMNIDVRNTGNTRAENVIVNADIDGFVVLISFNDKDKFQDLVFPKDLAIPFYSFPTYSVTSTVGTVDTMDKKSVQLNIPIKYMSVLVGKVSYRNKDNNNIWMDVLITIVELHVKVKVSGDNFQTVESSTKIFGVGDPAKLLEQWNKALRERINHLKREALEELLKRQIAISSLATNTKLYSEIGIDTYRFDTTYIRIPETSTLQISAILNEGVALLGLTVAVGSILVSMPTSVVNGFGIMIFDHLEKILPKGIFRMDITLQTGTGFLSTGIALTEQQNSTLTVTSITIPESFEVSWEGRNYDVAIASNSTISSCQLDENGNICFNVIDVPNEACFYKIAVPSEILPEDFQVWCEGEQIYNFELTQNTTHSFLHFMYSSHGENHTIMIIPEFPLIMFLLFFFGLTLLVIKLRKKCNQHPLARMCVPKLAKNGFYSPFRI